MFVGLLPSLVVLVLCAILIYAVVLLFRILAQMAKSLNEISVVLQEILKTMRSGK